MIPKNVRDGATTEGLTGETVKFTIEGNGKAFRTLIDGLYSNKVRAVVRELCSNAADSHVEAGQTRPFQVSIPTSLDPVFRVRDFGVGLDHDGVMVLYTTIFRSTKEATNEQTGQLGLGSKSPFAYTDTFSVVAYDGPEAGTKRVYVAFLATDGVPAISFVASEPSTEPKGLEVSFPAKREDIRQFQREMQFVAMAYPDMAPEVEGMTVRLPEPRLSGKGWAIYPNGAFGEHVTQNHFVRQGSVIYPTDQAFPHLGYGWISVVDIPIGTAEVTASREALSMDDDTRRAIREIRDAAYLELRAQVDALIAAAKTRIEKAKVHAVYKGVLDNLNGSTTVSLYKDTYQTRQNSARYVGGTPFEMEAGEQLERADLYGKASNGRGGRRSWYQGARWINAMEYTLLDNFTLIVDEPETKVVRRHKRINLCGANAYVLREEDPVKRAEGVAWVTECFDLKPHQIKYVTALPDCPPPKSAKPAGPRVRRVLKPGQTWMPRNEGKVYSEIYGMSDRGIGEWPKRMLAAARASGLKIDWDDVFFVTEKQQEAHEKRNELPEDRRLDKVIQKALAAKVANAPLDEAQMLVAVHNMVGRHNEALPVVIEKFFPKLANVTPAVAQETLNMAELAQIDLRTRPIVATIDSELKRLADKYPLLFQRSNKRHFEHYVEAVQAATAAAKS